MYTRAELTTLLTMLCEEAQAFDDGKAAKFEEYPDLVVYPLVFAYKKTIAFLVVAKVGDRSDIGFGMASPKDGDKFHESVGQRIAMDKAVKNLVASYFGDEHTPLYANLQLKGLLGFVRDHVCED